jgi:hypothetical protein
MRRPCNLLNRKVRWKDHHWPECRDVRKGRRDPRCIIKFFPSAASGLKRNPRRKKLLIGLAILGVIVATYRVWKPFAKRNKWFVIATNVGLDSLRRYGFSSEQIGQAAVISLPESQLPADVKKIQDIYEQYLRYSGWSHADVAGRRVLELGPGFTIGVPLMFAADGASFVAGLDKFVRLQDGPYFVALDTRIRETLSNEQKAAFDRTIIAAVPGNLRIFQELANLIPLGEEQRGATR